LPELTEAGPVDFVCCYPPQAYSVQREVGR
jgi:hypothetical protein